jgi:hypothetical protein
MLYISHYLGARRKTGIYTSWFRKTLPEQFDTLVYFSENLQLFMRSHLEVAKPLLLALLSPSLNRFS